MSTNVSIYCNETKSCYNVSFIIHAQTSNHITIYCSNFQACAYIYVDATYAFYLNFIAITNPDLGALHKQALYQRFLVFFFFSVFVFFRFVCVCVWLLCEMSQCAKMRKQKMSIQKKKALCVIYTIHLCMPFQKKKITQTNTKEHTHTHTDIHP